jgi:hypothetical protein
MYKQIAVLCLGLLAAAPSLAAPSEPVYIGDFAAQAQSDASDRAVRKGEENAAALSEALVHELNSRGIAAYRLTGQDAAPRAGWIVNGVFAETLPHGLFSGLTSMGDTTPNTEVKIRIVDSAGQPISAISTAASLGGQSSSVSINPYVLAAKLVLHHVASDRSIDDLARRIADQILAQG